MQISEAADDAKRKEVRQGRSQGRPSVRDEFAAVGSLSRGLHVLDVISQAPRWLSLSEIAAETGLDASTTHRLLQVLMESGHVVRDDELKRYLPGPRALSPLSLFHPLTQLRREALPVLEFLQSQIGETCAFVLFIGQERLVVDFVRGSHPLSPYYDTWLKSPLYASASGKLLLAWMPKAEKEELLGPGPYPAHTAMTITSPEDLEVELKLVEQRGYAVAREDAYESLVALGVPLTFPHETRPVGCLVVTAPSRSLRPDSEPKVSEQLRAAATLLMNGSPAMQVFRLWTGRTIRRGSAGRA